MYKIYRVSDKDLNIPSRRKDSSHDVVLVYYNRFNKRCLVKTISSLEQYNKEGNLEFKPNKLDAVRNGEIIVIPKTQLKTRFLSGIYYKPISIHYKDLVKTHTESTFPKKYKKVIK